MDTTNQTENLVYNNVGAEHARNLITIYVRSLRTIPLGNLVGWKVYWEFGTGHAGPDYLYGGSAKWTCATYVCPCGC